MSRRLVVLRHGQTAHNAGGLWQGQLDVPLSELGVAQASAAAQALSGLSPSVIWSSDLARAAATAAALGSVCGLPVRYDVRLREVHVGQWQGMSSGDVAQQFPAEHAAMMAGEDVRRGVSGETLSEVTGRVRKAGDELLAGLGAGGTGVVVSHGVSGRALAASLVGLPMQLAWRVLSGLGNCRWALLAEAESGTWRIVEWNAGAPDEPVRVGDAS